MSTQFVRALTLALPALTMAGFAPDASAALSRWQDATFTPTYNDGLALTGVRLDDAQFISALSVPFLTFNGVRYELLDTYRDGAPVVLEGDGTWRVQATYRLPVEAGVARVTVTYDLSDTDAQYSDLAELRSSVSVNGPSGEYRFFWRIDADLRGARGDRAQLFEKSGTRGHYQAPVSEQEISLTGTAEFGRFKLRLSDGPDYSHLTQLRLALPEDGEAKAWLVKAHDGEADTDPAKLVNGETVQSIQLGEIVPQPILGSDLVLWYSATINGSQGDVGPTLYGATLAGRSAVIEMDKMPTTEWPVTSVNHNGQVATIESAFAMAGITINNVYRDGVIPDDEKLNIAELDAVLETSVTYQASQDTATQWYSWVGIARNLGIPGVLGIMADYYEYSSDEAYREGCFVLWESILTTLPMLVDAGYPAQDFDTYVLWTVTHETGHAYNQHHEDWWYNDTSCFYENSAIMGYSYDANTLFWDFGPNSNASMRGGDPEEYVRPGHGVDFIKTTGFGPYPYNTTRAHKEGHHQTNQFSGGGCE